MGVATTLGVAMTFPANAVERLLLQASQQQIATTDFVRALLDVTVFMPLATTPDGQSVMPTVTVDEQVLVPVFTSEEQLRLGAPSAPYAMPPVRELLQQLSPDTGLAVNIGGDVGLPIFADGLRAAEGGTRTLDSGTRVRIGEPASEPGELLDTIGAALRRVPAVRAARRCWAHVGDDNPGLVVGLDIDPDNPPTRQAALAAVHDALDAAAPEFTVDVVFSSERDAFTDWMSANAAPFFVA